MQTTDKKICLRILILITTHKLAEKASKIFSKQNIPIHYALHAVGTASNETMDILGLGTPERSILISFLPKETANETIRLMHKELSFRVPGNGIGFTLNLSGASHLILQLLSPCESQETISERKDESSMQTNKRSLIAAVVNHGFSEEVMTAARAKGATGGTVIHGRQISDNETKSLFGTDFQEEKEIVIIVADAEKKLSIMQAIGETCGMHSEAKGLVVSLPIESVCGLGEFS